jgi:MFS family permease
MRKVLFLGMVIAFLTSLSSTFYILYAIDKIGFALAATSTSAMLLTQLIFDYPSGSLGDYVGQRIVLAIAFVCYSIAFLLLTSASSFESFVIIGIINGFGNAQSSGSFDTWVDNNYRNLVEDKDPDRKIYGFARSRTSSMNNLALGFSFLLGGYLATEISREFVFAIQFGLAILVTVLILIFLTDAQASSISQDKTRPEFSMKRYIDFLLGGIRFLFSTRTRFLFIIGLSIQNVVWLIWGNLILFPLYYGYTGTDFLASTLRTTLFFTGIPLSFIMANVTKRISNNRFPLTIFLQVLLFFPSFVVLTFFNPPTNEFNPAGIIGVFILLGVSVALIFDVSFTLSQRILIDLVPSENRNSIYSLMPSIVSFMGIFVLPVAGAAVESYGLSIGITIAGIISLISLFPIYYGLRSKKEENAVIAQQSEN